jgi:hypothetical protein
MNSPNAEQIEALRDRIVDAIARRMMDGLRAGDAVPWSGSVKLTSAGVQVRSTVVPWAEVQERVNQSKGQYAILKPDGRGTLIQLSMIGRNFLPGWRIVRSMKTAKK